MFFFFFGLLCGVVLCQEVPTIPKVKPYLVIIWHKIKPVQDQGTDDVHNDEQNKVD